jgi:hypothetical protein
MNMKTQFTRVTLLLLVVMASTSGKLWAQELLLDSLRGSWTLTEQYNNKNRVETKGLIEFQEDGKFVSHGSYFGTAVGLYRTDETRSTIHIDIDGTTSEWSASIRNHVLRMTRVKKKKTPRIELVLVSERGENNSGSR